MQGMIGRKPNISEATPSVSGLVEDADLQAAQEGCVRVQATSQQTRLAQQTDAWNP